MIAAILFACAVVGVHDGDTWTCHDGTRVRLAAIDAPELGPCRGRRGRVCVPGSGQASKRALASLIANRVLRCEHVGWSYRRRVAHCWTPAGVNVGCEQIRRGFAVYQPRYDSRRTLENCGN